MRTKSKSREKMPQDHGHLARRVPNNFFCPISKKFMREPAIVPSTNRTYDRKSLISLRMKRWMNTEQNSGDDSINILPREDEFMLMPNHDLRSQISAWLCKYDRRPPFAYISTPEDFAAAVTSILSTLQENDILEVPRLMTNLRELNSTMQTKPLILSSPQGFLSLCRLIAEFPVASYSSSTLTEWVQLCVGILVHVHQIKNNIHLTANYQDQMFSLIGIVCADIHDPAFQLGLVTLIHSFLASEGQVAKSVNEQIIKNVGIMRSLTSYILSPSHKGFAKTKEHFDKLFYVIIELWATKPASMREPKLAQAVASLLWPMPQMIDETQYFHLFETLSSTFQWQPQNTNSSFADPVEVMGRAGLVSRIFHVLNYAKRPEQEKLQNLEGWLGRGILTSPEAEAFVVMRCFDMLRHLSSSSLGRLEIVRVMTRSGYRYMEAFFSVLAKYSLPLHKDSHVVPALSVLFNLMEYTRYNSIFHPVHGLSFQVFLTFVRDTHPRVRAIAGQLYASHAHNEREEQEPPLQIY